MGNLIIMLTNPGRSLGKGTFGKVKLATHILTGEKVQILSNIDTLTGCY